MKKTSILTLAFLSAVLPACMVALAQDTTLPFVMAGGARNAPLPLADGRAIYEHVCQSCHMADGRGASLSPATYPALAGNAKLAARAYPALMVVNGLGAMPAFGSLLTDEQVAAVVNYVRSTFGNAYGDALQPSEVKSLRPALQAAPTELRGR